MSCWLTRLFAAALSGFMLAAAAFAQEPPPRSPLGVAPPAAERGLTALRPSAARPPSTAEAGLVERAWAWVLVTQQKLNRDLAAAVRGLKTDPARATFVLAWLSFAYGVLHAAGPGHGKAVISAYVLANERTVRRGIMLSFLAAFVQALSALAVVVILSIALKATSLTLKSAEAWIETLSWALVAAVGAWLLYGQLKPLLTRTKDEDASLAAASDHHHSPAHHHHHEHHGDCCGHVHSHGQSHSDTHAYAHTAPSPSHEAKATAADASVAARTTAADAHAHTHVASQGHATGHGHVHNHDHGADCGCGHAHMPSPQEIEGPLHWRKALAIAFSVGIRPCTGAILVLLFALSQGLMWAGVMATFAMALGTAITVSALAALAVGSREVAMRLAGGAGSGWAGIISATAGIVGSSLVLLMGVAFFIASLRTAAVPF